MVLIFVVFEIMDYLETQEAKRWSIFTFKNADCEVDIN